MVAVGAREERREALANEIGATLGLVAAARIQKKTIPNSTCFFLLLLRVYVYYARLRYNLCRPLGTWYARASHHRRDSDRKMEAPPTTLLLLLTSSSYFSSRFLFRPHTNISLFPFLDMCAQEKKKKKTRARMMKCFIVTVCQNNSRDLSLLDEVQKASSSLLATNSLLPLDEIPRVKGRTLSIGAIELFRRAFHACI